MSSTFDLPIERLLGQTRSRVVELLRAQPRTIADLAGELGITEEAVRRHLRELEQDGLVESEAVRSGGRGRPSSVHRLTDRGHRLFPQRAAELANELWRYLEEQHGRAALLGFLRWRREQQRERYDAELAEAGTLEERADQLAELLSADGFLARTEVAAAPDGRPVLRLTQTHCAVQDVAAEHPEICAHEAAMFRDLLGARVSRRTTIAGGDASCVCVVDPGTGPDAALLTDPDRPTDHTGA